ncbi:hypothetical protein B0H63DRAFT_556053 [Podospora didyma]|uniref:Nuclear membrane fusion protein Kar5 n=1 Tax=Podospora didyma TaxID=330526 RepID=A0AAE0P7T9_9PEZI|nr:hypothetical protein B0H63DRAFT_556053 [Podospora didyma]
MQVSIIFLAPLLPCIYCFSWGGEKKATHLNPSIEARNCHSLSQQPSRVPDIYAIALTELQELESEPLCHRVAARLLVNNCQLVDGKDDATILTDSGRQVQDFVDSYAASLAICDLERGSFVIPKECAKFREPSLSQIAIRNEPQLHVSTKEISLCLSALSASDAAWTTWISYRHKALRFCEAARAENEKDQNILLYQRLTKVIAKLTEGVEVELQKRMDDMDSRARKYVDTLSQLSPQIDQLRGGIVDIQRYISGDLEQKLRKSTETVHDGLQNAEDLQQLLRVLLNNVLEGNSQLASAHETSLQHASRRASDDIGALMAVVGMAATSTTSLQQQLELSSRQAARLADRQDALEQGMDRLLVVTENLSAKYDDHTHMLKQASNLTNDVLDVLAEAASTAAFVNTSRFEDAIFSSWWPHIVFPAASLVLGSYGLPPSISRNLGLLALGEAIASLFLFYDEAEDLIFLSTPANIANTTISTL